MHWITIQMGFMLLLLLLGCSTQKPQTQWVEISASGFKDFHLTCQRPNAPILITSNYTGSNEAHPSVITNGSVVFFVTGTTFNGLGWDNEDLSRGGHILDDNIVVTGLSVVGDKWWNKIMQGDKRFTIQDASDYQGSKEESGVSSK